MAVAGERAEQCVAEPRQPAQRGRRVSADQAAAAQVALAADRDLGGVVVVPHAAQHLDDALPRFGAELVAEVAGALGGEPAQPHRRVGRRGGAEARVAEAVERVERAPGLRVVEQAAGTGVDQRAAFEWPLQLLQVQHAADLGAVEQHRGGVAPAGIADGVEIGAAAIEVTADARAL